MRWLEALVWPGQQTRLDGLRAAITAVRAHPTPVICGDLRTDLTRLAAAAPVDATWIANERPRYIPGLADEIVHEAPSATAFLLARDATPIAWTDPHGASITWRAG